MKIAFYLYFKISLHIFSVSPHSTNSASSELASWVGTDPQGTNHNFGFSETVMSSSLCVCLDTSAR